MKKLGARADPNRALDPTKGILKHPQQPPNSEESGSSIAGGGGIISRGTTTPSEGQGKIPAAGRRAKELETEVEDDERGGVESGDVKVKTLGW